MASIGSQQLHRGIPTKGWSNLFKNRVSRSKHDRPQTKGVYLHYGLPGAVMTLGTQKYLIGNRGEWRRIKTTEKGG